jgi:hypothetical protein
MADAKVVITAEDRTKRGLDSVNQNLNRTAKNAQVVTGRFKNFRGASQQLGFQIQDVAVQLQSGTAAATVFGQQGSQIASIFGPGGAVIGALIAVGAAVAGPFISSIFGGTDALKKMEEAAGDVSTGLASMTETQRLVALRANLAAVQTANEEIAAATAERLVIQEKLARASTVRAGFGELTPQQIKDQESLNAELKTQNDIIDQANIVKETAAKADKDFAEAQNKIKDPLVATNAALKEQIATFGLGAQAVAVYRAALDGVVTAEERNNIALAGSLDKLKADKKEKEDKAKQDKDLAKQKKKDSEDVITNLDNQLEASARMNKSMFALNKAVNIAQAIMDTRASATLALKTFPPPFGQIAAAANIAFGLQQVAAIKSASFEGGGFTGMGARSGGIDGRGGFLATLHPNESVIDHTKGQGGGITVINNVDARGSGADVDQKIKTAMAQTSQQTILTIQDLMRRRRFA